MVCDVRAFSVDVRHNACAGVCAAAAAAVAVSLIKGVQCMQLIVNMTSVTGHVTRQGQSNLQRANLHKNIVCHLKIK